MAEDKENPLARWSRLKSKAAREAEAPKPKPNPAPAPAPRAAEAALPELPPIDQLTPDSDFSGFMDPRVDERLRRLALKKLFNDPRLNVVDGLDDFAEDYSLLEDLPQELVAKLEHVRSTLRRPEPEEEEEQKKETGPERSAARAADAEAEAKNEDIEGQGDHPQDVSGRQDA